MTRLSETTSIFILLDKTAKSKIRTYLTQYEHESIQKPKDNTPFFRELEFRRFFFLSIIPEIRCNMFIRYHFAPFKESEDIISRIFITKSYWIF